MVCDIASRVGVHDGRFRFQCGAAFSRLRCFQEQSFHAPAAVASTRLSHACGVLKNRAFTRLRRASYFLLSGQEKCNQREGHPGQALCGLPALRVRNPPSGPLDGTSLCRRSARAHRARVPSGYSSGRLPPGRGPSWWPSWPRPRTIRFHHALPRNETFVEQSSFSTQNPVVRAEQRSRTREQGALVRGHGWPSWRRPVDGKARRAHRSLCERCTKPGWTSLCLHSLVHSRESNSHAEGV